MITFDPRLDPGLVMALDRQESFVGYYRAYGDRLARHYEDNGIIFIPNIPITFDLELFATQTWPQPFKKVGTDNGLARPVYFRQGTELISDGSHPLMAITNGNAVFSAYLQSHIAAFNSALLAGLQHMFPRYRLEDYGITWRLTPTENEAPHLDVFAAGRPLTPAQRKLHRLKVFINIDAEPRHWRISSDIGSVLRAAGDRLPHRLPNDVNVLCDVINRSRVLESMPWHDIKFPQMSAVIANGETVPHQVLFGRRTIGFEGQCDAADMLDPSKLSHARLGSWLSDAGYEIDPDPTARAEKFVSGPPSYL